jgi:transcriptional regulator with XRE-family HTH domain
MKDRIRIIIEKENLTPAKFADRLQINRAIISHILNGRNNPSLDVVTRILTELNYINPEWLLKGTGSIYKDGIDRGSIPQEPDLFNQNEIKPVKEPDEFENRTERAINKRTNNIQESVRQSIVYEKTTDKKITQIIIYFSDHSFETFIPHPVKG